MKRLFLIAAILLSVGTLSAQNCIIVNSEKIFKSIDAYNTAISELDSLAKQYQTQVDERFAEVEKLYNGYMAQRSSLAESMRNSLEELILSKEKEAQQFQESLFGKEGTLMKQRLERIQPIQKQVFAAIEIYAGQVGADAVIDSSNNPTLLYNNPSIERTQQVIDLLKQQTTTSNN